MEFDLFLRWLVPVLLLFFHRLVRWLCFQYPLLVLWLVLLLRCHHQCHLIFLLLIHLCNHLRWCFHRWELFDHLEVFYLKCLTCAKLQLGSWNYQNKFPEITRRHCLTEASCHIVASWLKACPSLSATQMYLRDLVLLMKLKFWFLWYLDSVHNFLGIISRHMLS